MRSRQVAITLFMTVFLVLCVLANWSTKDNMYHPARVTENVSVEPVRVEAIDKGTDIFYLELEEIDETNNTLLFYTNHQEVFAYVGDELIYSLEMADSIFGRTPGAMWNTITLPVGSNTVSIKVSQVYPDLPKQEMIFECGSIINMYRAIIDDSLVEVALATAIIAIGIGLTAYWFLVFRKPNYHREIVYLGCFAIIFGIWNLGETQFVVFLFDNRAFWSYLAFTCLMTMCLPALYFFRTFLEVKDRYFYKIITAYIVTETIVCQILHLTGVMGVKETANYTMVSIVLILIYLLFAIISGIRAKRNLRKISVNIIGLTILVITAVIDMSSYYTNLLTADKVAKIGFLFYAVLLGIETIRLAQERQQEEQKLEIIREMAVKDMLTGCYNRNAYSEDTGELDDLTGVQVLTFDLNDLKKCNDTKGHKAGDKYIMDAAHMIRRIFGSYGKVYRIGGDEFCIVTRNISEKSIMQKKIDLNKAISKYLLENEDSGFGIACGYAKYDEEMDLTIEETRHRADLYMYENKKELKA